MQKNLNILYKISICARIYRTDYLIGNNYHFPECVVFEDLGFSIKTLYFANKVFALSDIIYYYRYNQNSTMNKTLNQRSASILFDLYILAGTRLIDLANELEIGKIRDFVLEGGVWRLNMFTKYLFDITMNEIEHFNKLIYIHRDILIPKIQFFNKRNKLIINYFSLYKWYFKFLSPLKKIIKKSKYISIQ